MQEQLQPNERIDDLQYNGLRIIQNKRKFCFGMDAVLLADFAQVRQHDKIADLGTGTGILPLLLSQKEASAAFECFEIQTEMAEMAARSARLNGLENRIHIHAADLRSAPELIGRAGMNAVVCNPPYGKRGSALTSKMETISIARHETDCTVGDVAAASASLLAYHGRLSMVFPARRMLELFDALRRQHMEPKRVRIVCAKASRAPYLVLAEAVKDGKPNLLWLPPLIVCHEDGTVTDEIDRIYHRL